MDTPEPPFRFRYIRVSQPIGDFYIASIPFDILLRISYADVRRLTQDRDVESYLGIQRPLSSKRVAELAKYVALADATFPTSIIIAIEERCAVVDEDGGFIELSASPGDDEDPGVDVGHIAKVIDGQHRIAGLEHYTNKTFELNVTIFIGADISDQAAIFSTVNLEQTRVSKSLAYDLLALAKQRTPEKTCHNTAVVLDSRINSPFHKKIKRLGVATPGRANERITQATFVKGLLPLLSDDAASDRAALQWEGKLPEVSGSQLKRTPFRNFFVREDDAKIAVCVWDYFDAISKRWRHAWNSDQPGFMLARTNGYLAAMRFLRVTLAERRVESMKLAQFETILEAIDLDDEDFVTANFAPGSSGEGRLFRSLRAGHVVA